MMKSHKKFRIVFLVFLMICSMPMQGQMNLTTSATATADTSHVDYPAAGAIDRDTTDGTGWGVSAIDTVYESEINIAPNAVASADDSSGPPSDAIDGDTTDWTGWSVSASFDVDPHWLDLNWAAPVSVNRIVLFTNSAENGAYALRAYDIQYWNGTAYQTVASVEGNKDPKLTSTFPSITTTRIRILCKDPDSASKWYRINEVEVYNDAQTTIENKTPENIQDALKIVRDATSLETVVVAQEEIHQIQIYSMKGILVYQNLKSAGTHNYRISSGALAPGAYVVRINRNKSEKFVIW